MEQYRGWLMEFLDTHCGISFLQPINFLPCSDQHDASKKRWVIEVSLQLFHLNRHVSGRTGSLSQGWLLSNARFSGRPHGHSADRPTLELCCIFRSESHNSFSRLPNHELEVSLVNT